MTGPHRVDDPLDLSTHESWLLVLDVVVALGGDDVTAARARADSGEGALTASPEFGDGGERAIARTFGK